MVTRRDIKLAHSYQSDDPDNRRCLSIRERYPVVSAQARAATALSRKTSNQAGRPASAPKACRPPRKTAATKTNVNLSITAPSSKPKSSELARPKARAGAQGDKPKATKTEPAQPSKKERGTPAKPQQATEVNSAIAEPQSNENAPLTQEEAIAMWTRIRDSLRPKRTWLMR